MTTITDVHDIHAARDEMIARGVDVSEIWHIEPGQGRVPGPDPQRRSYLSRASFADPDGNTRILEEITDRLPGRVEMRYSGPLAQLLFETAKRHGQFAGADTPHDWWDWYAAYMDARQEGSMQEDAATAAGRYMAAVTHVETLESSPVRTPMHERAHDGGHRPVYQPRRRLLSPDVWKLRETATWRG
jgi:hypothetical protein